MLFVAFISGYLFIISFNRFPVELGIATKNHPHNIEDQQNVLLHHPWH
jgi:hypothetical protein